MKPTDELSAMLRSADHEPLLSDDEIYRLLAAPPVAAQQPAPRRVWYYAAAATVTACAIGVYTMMQPSSGSDDASTPGQEATTATQQSPQEQVAMLDEALPAIDADHDIVQSRAVRQMPSVTFEQATPELLADLGIAQESSVVRFVDGRMMVTITNRGIGIRPTRSQAHSDAPVAVTLYDANGAYASWHDADAPAPNVGYLRALRFALPNDDIMGRTNVTAVLWYAPRSDKSDASDRSDAFRVERVAPNPVVDDVATVTVRSTALRAVRARLLDIVGRELMPLHDVTSLAAGTNTVVLTGLSRLPGGMVFLIIEDLSNGTFITERILLQR